MRWTIMCWMGLFVMGCQTTWTEERFLRHMADEECAFLRACNSGDESWITSRAECREDLVEELQQSLEETRETSGCTLDFNWSIAAECARAVTDHWDVDCDEMPDNTVFSDECSQIWVVEC